MKMNKLQNRLIISLGCMLVIILNVAQAESTKSVMSLKAICDNNHFSFSHGLVLFEKDSSSPKQRLYLIQNTSKADLWLDHPVKEPGASAGWASQLMEKNWSAIAIEKDKFALNCVEIKPGSEQHIPCGSVLQVCSIEKAMFSKHNLGTYWVAENESLPIVLNKIKKRGIEFVTIIN